MEFIIEIFKSTWEKLTGIHRLLNALKLWKPDTFPNEYQTATRNLEKVEAKLKALNAI